MADLSSTLPVVRLDAQVYALSATGRSLADDVLRVIQDASYTYEDVIDLFNDCLMEIAGSHLLPELETFRDVYTVPNVNSIAMPADYHRNLRYCHSITQNAQRKIYGSRSLLMQHFSNLNQVGRVIGVAVNGRELYYQRVPSDAEQLHINYYRYPEKLVSADDKPTCIEWHLAKKLLKAYALKELYAEIEDDETGKVNVTRYEKKYEQALAELTVFIGPEEDVPDEFDEAIDWEAMA